MLMASECLHQGITFVLVWYGLAKTYANFIKLLPSNASQQYTGWERQVCYRDYKN